MHACMYVYIYICSMSIDGVYQTLEYRYIRTYYFPDEDGGSTLAGTSEAQGDARRCLQHAGCGSIWDDHHRGPVAIAWDWGKNIPKKYQTCRYKQIYTIVM